MNQLLPGQLLYIFGASFLDAAVLSWLALFWYRHSVNRLMREVSAGAIAESGQQHTTPCSVPA